MGCSGCVFGYDTSGEGAGVLAAHKASIPSCPHHLSRDVLRVGRAHSEAIDIPYPSPIRNAAACSAASLSSFLSTWA